MYIQKMDTVSGGVTTTYPTKETISNFSLHISSIPFKISGKAKDVTSVDFKDKDGKKVYHPSVLRLDSYDMDIEFAYKGEKKTANVFINNFVKYLTGRDGTGTGLMIYSTYSMIGRTDMMFKELKDDANLVRSDDGDILYFKITFTVNDPVTDIGLVNGKLAIV